MNGSKQLTSEDKQHLIQCINLTIKSSENSIHAAKVLLPIAEKLELTRPKK